VHTGPKRAFAQHSRIGSNREPSIWHGSFTGRKCRWTMSTLERSRSKEFENQLPVGIDRAGFQRTRSWHDRAFLRLAF
jgi:hypothetical protein